MQSLGDRMKGYESASKLYLPKRSYNMIRVDGKAFHTLTKNFDRPFDLKFIEVMDRTAIDLCSNIQGAKLGYVQSDEISVVFTDLDSIKTSLWFDGNKSKIESISAATATEAFNFHFHDLYGYLPRAKFDARTWSLPDPVEVHNCFVWRQRDWERNSLQMYTRAFYSHKEVHKKNTSDMHEMLHQKGQNWDKLPSNLKRGRFVTYESGKWSIPSEQPILTKEVTFVHNRLPKYEYIE